MDPLFKRYIDQFYSFFQILKISEVLEGVNSRYLEIEPNITLYNLHITNLFWLNESPLAVKFLFKMNFKRTRLTQTLIIEHHILSVK